MLEDEIEEDNLPDEEQDNLDMDADEIGFDDLETDDELTQPAETVDADDGNGDEAPVTRSKAKPAAATEELPSVESRKKDRDALAMAMVAFLKKGGKIQPVASVDD